jgi:hypothetical protein
VSYKREMERKDVLRSRKEKWIGRMHWEAEERNGQEGCTERFWSNLLELLEGRIEK